MNILHALTVTAAIVLLQSSMAAPARASFHGAGCFCTWYGDFDGDGVADRSFSEFAANCAAASVEVWTVVHQGGWVELTTDFVCADNHGFIGNSTRPGVPPASSDDVGIDDVSLSRP